MRTNPKFWSDGFKIVDDPDSAEFFDNDLEDFCNDDVQTDVNARQLTLWQQLEERLGERQLRADLDDWYHWDEQLAAH